MSIEWLWGLIASLGLLAFGFFMHAADAKRHIRTLDEEINSLKEKLKVFEDQQITIKRISAKGMHGEQCLADQLNEGLARE